MHNKALVSSFLILLLAIPSLANASDTLATNYGELFLEDEPIVSSDLKILTISYQVDVSNTFSNVKGLVLGLGRSAGPTINYGIQVGFFKAQDSEALSALTANNQVESTTYNPNRSIKGTFEYSPLSGHINLLSYKSMPFSLGLKTAAGYSFYPDGNENGNKNVPTLDIGVKFTSKLSSSVFINFEVSESYRSPFAGIRTNATLLGFGFGIAL